MKKHYTNYSIDFEGKVFNVLLEKLDELDFEGSTVEGADLHNEIFNVDYILIGCHEAKQAIADNINDLFCTLESYQEEFGETYMYLLEPERVLNLMYYMCGLELFNELEFLQQDKLLDQKDIQNILKQLKELE